MNKITNLNNIRDAALKAVDPGRAVRKFIDLESSEHGGADQLRVGESIWELSNGARVFLLAIGKAALPMIHAANEVIGNYICEGVAVVPHGYESELNIPSRIRVLKAAHPTPDKDGLLAALAVENFLLNAMKENDRLLVLLSGGASALLPLPANGISLKELKEFTTTLLKSGANIQEINTVRKHIERLKGGQLARLAYPTPMATLILSDVVGNKLAVIGSGPTVPDPTTFQDAWRVLEKYDLVRKSPSSIIDHIQSGVGGKIEETPKPGNIIFNDVTNIIICSNYNASQAAVLEAEQLGYNAIILTTFLEGEACEVGKLAAAIVKEIQYNNNPISSPACIVMGGETTVTVKGNGLGGRNQEVALSAALALDGVENTAIMAFATDGIDGPTDAAGAIIDGTTVDYAKSLGLDAQKYLTQNNAYKLLEATGSLIFTGPTGTNVNDLLILMVDSAKQGDGSS